MSDVITPETMREHRARWFVYAGGERIPYQRTMRGAWGYDVVCSCGWETTTGGAIKPRVAEALWDHRFSAQTAAELRAEARDQGVDPDDQASYMRFLQTKISAL